MTRNEAINYLRSSGMTDDQIETITSALTPNLTNILCDIYLAGVNMAGEYHGCWVRFKDVETILEKYMEVEE